MHLQRRRGRPRGPSNSPRPPNRALTEVGLVYAFRRHLGLLDPSICLAGLVSVLKNKAYGRPSPTPNFPALDFIAAYLNHGLQVCWLDMLSEAATPIETVTGSLNESSCIPAFTELSIVELCAKLEEKAIPVGSRGLFVVALLFFHSWFFFFSGFCSNKENDIERASSFAISPATVGQAVPCGAQGAMFHTFESMWPDRQVLQSNSVLAP